MDGGHVRASIISVSDSESFTNIDLKESAALGLMQTSFSIRFINLVNSLDLRCSKLVSHLRIVANNPEVEKIAFGTRSLHEGDCYF